MIILEENYSQMLLGLLLPDIPEESFTVEEVKAVIKNLNPKKVGLQSHNYQVAQKVPETKIKIIT